jgi:hypothetical protein
VTCEHRCFELGLLNTGQPQAVSTILDERADVARVLDRRGH